MKKSLKLIMISASLALSGCAHLPSSSPVAAPNTSNKMALRIYQALPDYQKAEKMSWQPVADNNTNAITQRLTALHYLSGSDSLAQGIATFQRCHGLQATGIMNAETLHALNTPPTIFYHLLIRSMHAWAKYSEDQNSRYIQVNIPSYSMQLISHGETVLHMRAIVGRMERPTPTLTSTITTVVFNPTWTVPETILAKDVIPGMQKNPNYLKEHYDMRVYANWQKNAAEINPSTIDWQTANAKNFQYRVTAPASNTNPLGRFKFIFANSQDIYMHDTPEKSIFSLDDRARSSGCIRLENPAALVAYFQADNSDLNPVAVTQYLSTHDTKYVQLKNPLPIEITYITAWVDTEGRAHFNDIYHLG